MISCELTYEQIDKIVRLLELELNKCERHFKFVELKHGKKSLLYDHYETINSLKDYLKQRRRFNK